MDKDDDVKAFIKEYRENKKATERSWNIAGWTFCIGMLIIIPFQISAVIEAQKTIDKADALIMKYKEARENKEGN